MPISDADLQQLYDRYAHVVYRRALGILGNEEEAADAVQETFARVIVHYDGFRKESSPLTWMYRISTNYCLNRMRNRSTRAHKRLRHKEAIVGDGFSRGGAEHWEAEETIRRLLEDTDEETRRMVIHLFFDEMTRQETARMLGISVPTLRKRLRIFLSSARKSMLASSAAGTRTLLAVMIACYFMGIRWIF